MGPTVTVAVSGVRSETHALHVSGWVSAEIRSKGAQMIITDLDSADELAPSFRHLQKHLPSSAHLSHRRHRAERYDRYVAVGSPGIKPLFSLVLSGQPFVPTTAVDEGLGSYASPVGWYRAARREGRSSLKSAMSTAGKMVTRSLLTREEWRYFSKREDFTWTVNPVVSEYLRSAAGNVATEAESTNFVAVLTQPWVELGLASEKNHMRQIERIVNEIGHAGREALICPHPFEPSNRYKEWATTDGTPAELNPSVLSASSIIGGESTASLLLSAVLGQPLIRIRMTGSPEMTGAQKALFDQFVGPARDVQDLRTLIK